MTNMAETSAPERDTLLELADRVETKARRCAEIAISSPLNGQGHQADRKAALEWFQIAAALRARAAARNTQDEKGLEG